MKIVNKGIKTKWGTAKLQSDGYYRITSGKEGNCGKLLHDLIWEDENCKKVPEGHVVHHIDLNPLNNDISNLELMSRADHARLHHTGKTGYWKDKTRPLETRQKISEANKGRNHHNFNSCIKINKRIDKNCKQGYHWKARPYTNEGRKYISSVNLDECIKKVEDFLKSENNTYGYETYEVNL